LAYSADIFGQKKEEHLSTQSLAVTIIDVAEKLIALLAKLPLCKWRLEADNYANFPMLEEVLNADLESRVIMPCQFFCRQTINAELF
jgi:hypothetical protein